MKITLETLGCKLNQAETDRLAREFLAAGHQLVTRNDNPDIYILNTCTVTHTADSKSRHLLRMVKSRNPKAHVVVTGCYADRTPLELAQLDEVDLVTGNEGKATLLQRLETEGYLPAVTGTKGSQQKKTGLRTRTFVKIQDGCRNFCAYCIVPYVRRDEMSVPPDEVVDEIKKRVAEGYQEAVLTGTRIGAYNAAGFSLKDLVTRLLKETAIPRLRLSSLQPQEITPDLLALWQNHRLCPHFHLSLQSGSPTVLQRMRRRYSTADFEKTIALIRALVPDVAMTTDVITGFPGETEKEFEDSYSFCQRMDFARIHVFTFSPRKGTEAAQMTGQIADVVKKERTRKMLALAETSASKFREKFSGMTLDVLWEQEVDNGVWSGITGNYLRVHKKDSSNLTNKLGTVKMQKT